MGTKLNTGFLGQLSPKIILSSVCNDYYLIFSVHFVKFLYVSIWLEMQGMDHNSVLNVVCFNSFDNSVVAIEKCASVLKYE